MSETNFKKKVISDLKKLDKMWFIKTAERGRHGVPDILMCLCGRFIAIELKREKGRTTKLQDIVLENIILAEGYALVASPSTWPAQYLIIEGLTK
jgi:hypothetical protein